MALLSGRVLLAAAATLAFVQGLGNAQSKTALAEDEIKAAFLYNFAKFIVWPPRPEVADAALVIGVFDRDSFASTLEALVRDKTVNGRRLAVRRLTVPQDSRACHMVFVASGHQQRLREIVAAATPAGVLTVGEWDQFTQRGGMINFVKDANRIRFEINVDATARAGLRVSSRLLHLARVVREEAAAR